MITSDRCHSPLVVPVLLLVVGLTLVACGKKGSLYLPEPSDQQQAVEKDKQKQSGK